MSGDEVNFSSPGTMRRTDHSREAALKELAEGNRGDNRPCSGSGPEKFQFTKGHHSKTRVPPVERTILKTDGHHENSGFCVGIRLRR